MTPQFGASITDDCKTFIVQVTGLIFAVIDSGLYYKNMTIVNNNHHTAFDPDKPLHPSVL